MSPKGYELDFYKVFVQKHDHSPKKAIELPVNFSYSEPKGFLKCKEKCVGLIVGGSNAVFEMRLEDIKRVTQYIFREFKDYKKVVTTSPRTPKEIERFIEEDNFDYKVIFSKNPINPIGDFLKCCERVFITVDSTSMISEAVSFGKSSVEVVLLEKKKKNKYEKMVKYLQNLGCLHIFDGKVKSCNKKIDLKDYVKEFV